MVTVDIFTTSSVATIASTLNMRLGFRPSVILKLALAYFTMSTDRQTDRQMGRLPPLANHWRVPC